MKYYARVVNGEIFEVISSSLDIATLYSAEFVKSLIDITNVSPLPEEGWLASKAGDKWVFSKPVAENDVVLTAEEIIQLRRKAYKSESDPVKFEAEYNALVSGADVDYAEWLAKVKEIKLRLPLPGVDPGADA